MSNIRMAVVGAGAFGRNHLRVLRQLPGVELVVAVDTDLERARQAAGEFGCQAGDDYKALKGQVDAAVVAVPTVLHADVACTLLEDGIDVLVEKPIAASLHEAQTMIDAAAKNARILQVGHLERFNPAVQAVTDVLTLPLFFEIHRMSMFTPRSLDVDVVLDLMIHDVDILLSMTGQIPSEVQAAGIRILSNKVDIANVRLAFMNGCVANLTASRVSTEKIRKLRLFQPNQYISLDYRKQDAVRFTVSEELSDDGVKMSLPDGVDRSLRFDALTVRKDEPLRLEVEAFLDSVRTRRPPKVSGEAAARALAVCLSILGKIEEHGQQVASTLASCGATGSPTLTS